MEKGVPTLTSSTMSWEFILPDFLCEVRLKGKFKSNPHPVLECYWAFWGRYEPKIELFLLCQESSIILF